MMKMMKTPSVVVVVEGADTSDESEATCDLRCAFLYFLLAPL
jgi:hypothetical protein